jgi:Outer membrane protein beta-barrel domain
LLGRLALSFLLGGASTLYSYSQAIPTASRTADVQVGVGYSIARPDYVQQTFPGFAVYGDFDFRPHIGVEAEYHQVYSTNGDLSFERTYAIGGRYLRTYGPLVPYVKAMIGRGDFNYPFSETELSYNMFAGGVGADFKLGSYLRVRGEYEFQKWISFPNGGLTPQIVTFGVAYHFAGKPGYR